MPEPTADKFDLDMKMRLAADRVLRAVTLQRQAKVAVLASAALSIVAAVQPDLLPADLVVLKNLLNVGAISGLLRKVAEDGEVMPDEDIAGEMKALLPLDELDRLATGQKDMLRALTRQHTWQQQMLRLQEADREASAQLLAEFGEMTGDLAAIRDLLAGAATGEQVEGIIRLITDEVLPRLSEPVRAKYNMSGDFRAATIFIESTVQMPWQPLPPFTPAPPPPPGELPAPGPLPPGSRMVYGRNPLFTGREDDLRQLAAQLLSITNYELRITNEEPSELVTRRSSLVTSGIGGIGKTQLAVEFTHRFGRFFHGVHWVSMADPAAVETEIALCGEEMRLRPDFDALEREAQTRETLAAWSGPEPRLIIFDNCEEPALMQRWRPVSGGARLLVTSRNAVWPPEYGAAVRRVSPLSRRQSVTLLRQYLAPAGREETDEALGRVAAEVGDLPLALALAGHYLARYKREGVEAYLRALRDADDLLPVGRGAVNLTDHDLSIRRTFAVSYDVLAPGDEVDAAAVALLARAACFAPGEPLPEALLLATMNADTGTGGTTGDEPHTEEAPSSPVVSPLLLDDALSRLLELGLLERVEGDAVRLHRLITRFVEAESLRKGVEEGEGAGMEAARAAVESTVERALARANASGDPRSLRGVEIHLHHVVDWTAEREDVEAALLNNRLGYYLQMSGDFRAARPYYERALDINERVLGPEHPDTATSLNNLGALLDSMGDLAAARPYYERALDINERVLDPDHPNTARSLNNLGGLLDSMGDLAAARPYYERALEIRERVLGPDHPDTAQSLNNLGGLLRAMGDPAAARPYYERALNIFDRVLGPDHSYTAGSLNNLGCLLQAMGDLPAARPYYERALEIRERVLGPAHPDTAQSLNNLGGLLRAMGDLPAARPYYERALAVRERVLGPAHPDTARSLNNLGALLDSMGDLPAARPYYERALEIRERVLGPDHPDTATSLNNLGYLLDSMGDPAAARPYYERALEIRERVLGPDHPNTATSLNNLGGLLDSMGDPVAAQPYYERALNIRERVLGSEHPDTVTSIAWIGHLFQAQGDYVAAKPHLERVVTVRERVLGPDHPDTAHSLNNLGYLLQAMGDPAAARPYYERALDIRERVLGPDHPDMAQSLNNMGGLLHVMGELPAAKLYYERALAILESKLGSEHPHTRIVRENLTAIEAEL